MRSSKQPNKGLCPFLLLWTMALLSACAASPRSAPNAAERAPLPNLTGTVWQLRSIQSMADEQPPLTVDQPERYTLQFQDDGRLMLRLDCNRGTGSWQATPSASGDSGQLTIGPVAMTRMYCPPPSLDTRVARDLALIRSYLLRDGNLYLSLMADGGIYQWQPSRGEQ